MSEQNEGNAAAMELALTLLQGSTQASQSITTQLLETVSQESERRLATLMLIRQNVQDLVSGVYMPTPNAILHALYPSGRDVDRALEYYISIGAITPLMRDSDTRS